MQHIFKYSSKHCSAASGSAASGVFFSWLNYSLALQRHTGPTALLQALTLRHMRSNDYSTTKIFVDNFLCRLIVSALLHHNNDTYIHTCMHTYINKYHLITILRNLTANAIFFQFKPLLFLVQNYSFWDYDFLSILVHFNSVLVISYLIFKSSSCLLPEFRNDLNSLI